VAGKGTNRLEPQTQCLVMATDEFAQWVPLDMAGSPGTILRDAHPLCSLNATAVSVGVRARARAIAAI